MSTASKIQSTFVNNPFHFFLHNSSRKTETLETELNLHFHNKIVVNCLRQIWIRLIALSNKSRQVNFANAKKNDFAQHCIRHSTCCHVRRYIKPSNERQFSLKHLLLYYCYTDGHACTIHNKICRALLYGKCVSTMKHCMCVCRLFSFIRGCQQCNILHYIIKTTLNHKNLDVNVIIFLRSKSSKLQHNFLFFICTFVILYIEIIVLEIINELKRMIAFIFSQRKWKFHQFGYLITKNTTGIILMQYL